MCQTLIHSFKKWAWIVTRPIIYNWINLIFHKHKWSFMKWNNTIFHKENVKIIVHFVFYWPFILLHIWIQQVINYYNLDTWKNFWSWAQLSLIFLVMFHIHMNACECHEENNMKIFPPPKTTAASMHKGNDGDHFAN